MEVIILLDHDLEGQVALILDTRLTLPLDLYGKANAERS